MEEDREGMLEASFAILSTILSREQIRKQNRGGGNDKEKDQGGSDSVARCSESKNGLLKRECESQRLGKRKNVAMCVCLLHIKLPSGLCACATVLLHTPFSSLQPSDRRNSTYDGMMEMKRPNAGPP